LKICSTCYIEIEIELLKLVHTSNNVEAVLLNVMNVIFGNNVELISSFRQSLTDWTCSVFVCHVSCTMYHEYSSTWCTNNRTFPLCCCNATTPTLLSTGGHRHCWSLQEEQQHCWSNGQLHSIRLLLSQSCLLLQQLFT